MKAFKYNVFNKEILRYLKSIIKIAQQWHSQVIISSVFIIFIINVEHCWLSLARALLVHLGAGLHLVRRICFVTPKEKENHRE